MPETIMRLAHASGRHDADVHEVAAYLAENVRRYRLGLVTTTESQQRGILGITRETLGPRYGVRKRGEYMVIWDRAEFAPRSHATLWHLTALPRLIEWREMRAAMFRLRSLRLGIPVNAITSHAPAGVQDGDGWNEDNPLQVDASQKGHARLGKKMDRRRRRNPRLLQIANEDSNANQRLRRFRRWLKKKLRAASIWAKRRPNRGSHKGGRLIDTISLVAGDALGYETLDAGVSNVDRPPGYDHDLVWGVERVWTKR